MIKSFKDPLSRQLAEAVRIHLRGENILNAKTDYSRCRVPRLTVDLAGWNNSTREELALKMMGSSQLEHEEEELTKEAADSLEEREAKRKREDPPAMRKSKKRKLEKLTGWGGNSIHQEDPSIHQEDPSIRKIHPSCRKKVIMKKNTHWKA